MKKKIIPAPKG